MPTLVSMLTLALSLLQFYYIHPPYFRTQTYQLITEAINSAPRNKGITVTDTTHSFYESGALSRRTSARLDKGLEVHPTIGYKKGLCSFRSRPAIKQKGPWTVLATPDYVKSVLNTTWFMSCIQVQLKNKNSSLNHLTKGLMVGRSERFRLATPFNPRCIQNTNTKTPSTI